MKLYSTDYKVIVFKYVSLALIVLFTASCATMLSGPTQNIKVKTEPDGASIFVNGQNTFSKTPGKVKVKRRQLKSQHNSLNEINITVKKEGYEDATLNYPASFNPVSAASIIFVVPFLVDWASGSHLKYPRTHYLAMEPKEEIITIPLKPHVAVSTSNSDIDTDIPKTLNKNNNKFVLIIGNEDYASYQQGLDISANVIYAKNDALSFRNYAENVLGAREDHIIMLTNATLTQMKRAVNQLNLLAKAAGDKAELIFYYAGHGLPHEESKEPYLLPVDVSGTELSLAIKLSDVYDKLTEHDVEKVTCFLDCCFSGGAREQGLVASRGITVTPKNNELKKNLVVYSASSGVQSALPYREQQHGIFTYFLLRKLKESKGNLSYGELAEYLTKKVAVSSIVINNTEQEPQVNVSPQISNEWYDWSIK